MKILITGDVHNEFGYLNKLINKKKPDMVICCGDFGYWPRIQSLKKLSDIKLQSAEKLLWCDGNHEDHWSLRQRKTDEIAPNIFYMPRGSMYTLDDGRTILFMGGAVSIDKGWRTIGVDWFPEEIISQKDFENLPDFNTRIDIVVSHTCPKCLVEKMIKYRPEKNYEPSNAALSRLLDIFKPSLWFFGHWHQYGEYKIKETQFYALSAPGFETRWWMWLPERV